MKKKYLFLSLIAAMVMALGAKAQEETYNMIIKMADGTTVFIKPNDVDSISFTGGQVTISGQSIVNLLTDLNAKVDANTVDIDNLKERVTYGFEDLYDKCDVLRDQMIDTYMSLAEAKRQCDNNLAEAKAYVNTEIANVKAALMMNIMDELNDYYDKYYIDRILANYVKSYEIADFKATLVRYIANELNGYYDKEDINHILEDYVESYRLEDFQEYLNSMEERLEELESRVNNQ